MNKKTHIDWSYIALLLFVFSSTWIMVMQINVGFIKDDGKYCKALFESMPYNDSMNITVKTMGLYFPKADIYCVDMNGRTEAQIDKTEKHEYCHWLIDQDTENHFCEVKQ